MAVYANNSYAYPLQSTFQAPQRRYLPPPAVFSPPMYTPSYTSWVSGGPPPPPDFNPAPAIIGYRPVYHSDPVDLANSDAYTTPPLPEAETPPTRIIEETETLTPASKPVAAVAVKEKPAEVTEPVAEKAAPKKTPAAALTYEEQLGDRLTLLLEKNPQLTTSIKQWENQMAAKGIDLESLLSGSANAEQLFSDLLANPNSILNEVTTQVQKSPLAKLLRLIPGPIRKLFVSILPGPAEPIANQAMNMILGNSATSGIASSGASTLASSLGVPGLSMLS